MKNTSRQGETITTRRRGIGQGRGTRRQYTDKSGKSGHVSPAIVEKYLGGMHYPAEKRISSTMPRIKMRLMML